ncbi:hypothetical protein QEH56_23150 [Pelagicoccus enzymogenes]|uniref:TonB-dependent receptor plug domain-containing protein n=1 Tax=Pelagicoccus enzymogenes TaxID=2773457 RepID=UPI00280EA6EA|nr:TonB-dependent receptor plug domain-containing protein [Pelagicoccus enzymogenes]MDQ8201082.1 hypothetical protein [Pelagicoccus enzymogenes]
MKQTKKNPIPRFRTTLALSLLLGAANVGYSQEVDDDDEVFELSPFEVTSSEDDIGYYSERTLAGSRLNTKVSDLAASITVVTMQQMEDTAATDLNDVFLYESSTEGFGNFTATSGSLADRGTIKDAGAGYSFANSGESASAGSSNRVRGLAAPTITQNFYNALGGIPFDSYNTRSVEINRGPNSILSGLGSPAGIVNQSTASAAIGVNSTQVVFRLDDRGSVRGSFNHNQSLIEDKLAVYVAGLREEERFERKPSYDNTTRFYGAVRYEPFEKTKLRGSFERYSNNNRRPNSLTPRDFVTPWLEAGRPAYDNQTLMVTKLDTGEQFGPFVSSADSPSYEEGMIAGGGGFWNPDSPTYVPGIVPSRAWTSRPIVQVNPDGTSYAYEGYARYGYNSNSNYPQSLAAPGTDDRTDADWAVYDMQHTFSDFYNWDRNVANFVAPPVTDKSVYNWEEYNMLAMNYGSKEADTYNIEFEQEILENLHFSAGWFRQNYSDVQNYTVQQQTGATLYVDTNLNLPNGQPNPNFGLPFLEDYLPDTWTNEITNDNMRAQLAYQLKLADNDNWTKWLGNHNFLGFYSNQKVESLRLRLRGTTVGGDGRFLPWNDLTTTGNWRYYGNSARLYRNYYLASPGDPQATVTTGAPTHWGQPQYMGADFEVYDQFGGPSSYPVTLYNWETGQWEQTNTEVATVLHDATSGRNIRDLDSQTLGWQGYFLDNRIIATAGWRKDEVDLRNTVGSAGLGRAEFTDAGFVMPEASYNRWSFIDGEGNEVKNEDSVEGETSSYGVVAVPFRWDGGDFRVHYNESDNFNPPDSAQTDVFGNLLPKPTGEGTDYGFSVTAFDNKFTAKFNWFENSADNDRTGAAGTLIDRLTRIEHRYLRPWAEQIAYQQLDFPGIDYTAEAPEGGRPELTETQQAQFESRVEELTGLRYDWPSGLNFGATQTTIAEGMEIQLIYNPTKNWNMKMTAAQNETTTQNVAPQYDAWADLRVPIWQGLNSPLTAANDKNNDGDNDPNTFMFNGVRPADLSTFWSAYGYVGDFDITNPSAQWGNAEDFHEAAVLSQVALAKAQEGVASPNVREWRLNLISNYLFTDGAFKGLGIGGSVRWEDQAAIGYYGYAAGDDPNVLNAPDPSRPFYDSGNTNVDLWASYSIPIANEKVDWKIQLNIRNVQDSGELRPVSVDYAGNINAYRIIDPRQIFLTNTFTF